jgi:hypothetical protein
VKQVLHSTFGYVQDDEVGMRLAIVGAATAAGLIGIGIATGALLVVATVAAERSVTRCFAGKLLGRK